MVTIVFLQSLKNQRTTIVVLCLALIAFEALIAATFNSLYEDLPDIARDLLRAGGGSPTAYQAATGFRHPMFLVVVVGFVIAASSGAMAREIERGTAFILLARPIERYKVVLVRVATMVVVLLLMLLAAFVGVALGAQVFGLPDLDYGLLALGQVNALFLLTAVAGYSLFVSSLSNDGGKATSIAGGIAVVFFFVDYPGRHVGGGGGHRQAHPIPLLRPRHRVTEGMLDPLNIGTWPSSAAGLGAALVAFQRATSRVRTAATALPASDVCPGGTFIRRRVRRSLGFPPRDCTLLLEPCAGASLSCVRQGELSGFPLACRALIAWSMGGG